MAQQSTRGYRLYDAKQHSGTLKYCTGRIHLTASTYQSERDFESQVDRLVVSPFIPAGKNGEGGLVSIESLLCLLCKCSINTSCPSGSQLLPVDLQQPKQKKQGCKQRRCCGRSIVILRHTLLSLLQYILNALQQPGTLITRTILRVLMESNGFRSELRTGNS